MFNIHEIKSNYEWFAAFEIMRNHDNRLQSLKFLKYRLIFLTTLYPKEIRDEMNEVVKKRDKFIEAINEVEHYTTGVRARLN